MKQFTLFVCSLLATYSAVSQESIGSAGQNDKVSKAQVSWNIGETVVTSGNTSTGSVTQGYEQPGFTITSIELVNETSKINARVFPNPVVNDLNIELDGLENEIILLRIFDAQGKLVYETTTNENLTQLDLSPYSGAQYHLTLQSKDNTFFEKFSLIKSH